MFVFQFSYRTSKYRRQCGDCLIMGTCSIYLAVIASSAGKASFSPLASKSSSQKALPPPWLYCKMQSQKGAADVELSGLLIKPMLN
ncbi:hypothetical protein MRB53_009314 [Persea americana]|uniref:Uncharacterized protein n=1 Tax=Persea americana TaxID=3435 RepID=A0ACC2LNT6_PERAE|nr:hypothetical protein MRB53_009314 [Persea americana]